MSDEIEQEMPGQAEHFHESPYVHGVACGLQEKYDISDHVYSLLVYGIEVPVNENGEVAQDDDGEAVMAIMPPQMPGGVPTPITIPMLDGEDEFVIDRDKDDLQPGDIVAFYDSDAEQTRTGIYFPSEEEDSDLGDDEVALLVGNDDDMEAVIVETGGETNEVEINGETLAGSWSMANDDDEHEKGWWRIDEFESRINDGDTE